MKKYHVRLIKGTNQGTEDRDLVIERDTPAGAIMDEESNLFTHAGSMSQTIDGKSVDVHLYRTPVIHRLDQ
jgi:hypothetical protein